jgi:hypothetical protein
VERKTLTYFDYADEAYAITITVKNGLELTLSSAVNVEVGDAILQGTRVALVESINGNNVILNYNLNWSLGTATVNKPFQVRIAFSPLDAENPSIVKHFPEATFFFKEASFVEILAGFSSNNAPEEQSLIFPPSNNNGDYGNGIYGTFPYGGLNLSGGRYAQRTYVPLEPSRANWITSSMELNEPFANISLMGLNYLYNIMSTKLIV